MTSWLRDDDADVVMNDTAGVHKDLDTITPSIDMIDDQYGNISDGRLISRQSLRM